MTSFGYRLNPRYAIKECLSCGDLYTGDFCCSKGNVKDKILVPKLPKNYARCAKCEHPVNGPYCQGCALLREKLEEDLVTYFQNFQNIFESSDDSTNVVNAPREPLVVKQDHGVNPLHIDNVVASVGPYETFQCQPTNEDYYHEQNSCYNSNSFGFDHCQPPQYTVNHPIFNAHNDFLNSQNELSTSETTIMEQMTTLTSMCEMVCQNFQKKQEEKRIEEEQAANARYWKIPACCDDNDDYDSAITPVLSTEETDNSLSMREEHLDTIPVTESDEVIKSSVENLVPIPSEFEENIEYVEASPHDSELVSLEAAEIVIPEEEEIEDDNRREKLLNWQYHYSSDISLPNYEAFSFNNDHIKEISSGSTTTHSDISLPEYEVFYFYDDHIKEISSGSTTTHSNISLSEYDLFTFDLSNDQCPRSDRSDFTHEEFADELAHIISPPEYDCFYFWNLPDLGELISIFNSRIRENLSTTSVNLPIEDDHSPLLAYVVWIFLAYLTYPVIPPYLHPFGNENTIFDPGITINHFCSFKPGLSHRCGAFKKFN
nr:hypothetical protein [Tanacetum cinerariifolium]